MNGPVYFATMESPVGPLLLTSGAEALTGIFMDADVRGPRPAADWRPGGTVVDVARRQLDAYFAGHRSDFDLPLDARGTPFQQTVWRALRSIPYGETISYAELARRIGRPTAVRAVGAANGRNPIPIVVPCHRVVGADGTLTGYAGGIERKSTLLRLETRALTPAPAR